MRISINVSEVRPRTCSKCGKAKSLFRHHMGNDRQLGNYNDKIYKNYFKYLDCTFICNKCHMVIHFIYIPICQEWTDWSPAGAMKLRAKLIGICQLWLAGKVPNPEVTRIFKDKWQQSFLDWQRSRGKKKSTKGA